MKRTGFKIDEKFDLLDELEWAHGTRTEAEGQGGPQANGWSRQAREVRVDHKMLE